MGRQSGSYGRISTPLSLLSCLDLRSNQVRSLLHINTAESINTHVLTSHTTMFTPVPQKSQSGAPQSDDIMLIMCGS